VVFAPLVLLIASADSLPGLAPELTAEAKASPAAERWLTLDRNFLAGGLSRGGRLYNGDWDAAFSDVPESLVPAHRGHAFQIAARIEYVGGTATTLAGLTLMLLRSFSPVPAGSPLGSILVAAVGLTGALLGFIHSRIAYAALLEAVRLHNGAVNDALPEDQRLDLGEFGPQPATSPPPSAAR
jgi:hypothetical protein